MAAELWHSRLVANFNFRDLKPLPVCVPEAGLLNLSRGQVFGSTRLSWRNLAEKRHAATRYGRSLSEKPQPGSPENAKMWSSVQASRFHGSPYIYNNEEALASICHTVREGQTLTSIANQYETSVEDIASMNHIDNVDIVQAGQLLVVPVQHKILKRVPEITTDLSEVALNGQTMSSVSSVAMPDKLPRHIMSDPLSLQFVKASVLFLVLAPALAYFIRWLVYSIRLRMDEEANAKQALKRIFTTQQRAKHMRWQNILDDGLETSALDVSYGCASPDSQESQSKDAYKEICESYAELEPAYLKFLAESGLTKSGYWRGGIPSAASDENIR